MKRVFPRESPRSAPLIRVEGKISWRSKPKGENRKKKKIAHFQKKNGGKKPKKMTKGGEYVRTLNVRTQAIVTISPAYSAGLRSRLDC